LKILSLGYRITLIITYAFLVAPVVVVVLVSFNPVASLSINLAQVSVRWYSEFFRNANFYGSFLTSLHVAAITAIISTVLSVPAAYALVRAEFLGKNAAQAFLLSPVIIPAIILGVALLNFYFSTGGRGSFWSIIVAHIVLTCPYVVRTVSASLAGLDRTLDEAATGLGAGRLRIFFSITLPLMRSGVVAGAVFVFIVSFGELNATVFLTSPQVSTLPVQIFSELVWTTNPVVAAASVFQILVIMVGVLVIEYTIGITKAARF
jgi:putative spermidine/putrescine transport system permease protein